jgi:hypothetical protein
VAANLRTSVLLLESNARTRSAFTKPDQEFRQCVGRGRDTQGATDTLKSGDRGAAPETVAERVLCAPRLAGFGRGAGGAPPGRPVADELGLPRAALRSPAIRSTPGISGSGMRLASLQALGGAAQ